MKKRVVKKLSLSRETLLPLEEWTLTGVAGLSPGSRTLDCETYLYARCETKQCPP